MPLAITLGYKENGRSAEPITLYVGTDAGEGSRIANNPPPGILRTEYFKAPAITFRRYLEGNLEKPAEAPAESADEKPAKAAAKK